MRPFPRVPALSLLVVTIVFAPSGWSQTKPPSGGTGSGTTAPTNVPPTTTPPSTTRPGRTNIPNFPTSEPSRPIFLRGKVILDQGMQVPQPIPIQRVCGATVRREGYTDTRGNFSFIVGENSSFQDASEAGSFSGRPTQITTRQLWSCEIRADLPGYVSSSISLAGRDFNDTSEIGTIVLRRISGGGEGNSISVTSLKAPEKARKEYQKALESYEKQKYADADKHLAKALAEYPQYAAAWELRGKEQQNQRQFEEAGKSYQAAIAADTNFVTPYVRLALLEALKSNWPEVLQLSERAISLDSVSYPDAYFLNGVAHYNLQQFAEAERSAARAVQLDRDHRLPRAELLLANLLQLRGDNSAAAEHFKSYLKLEPQSSEAKAINEFLAKYENATATAKPADAPKP